MKPPFLPLKDIQYSWEDYITEQKVEHEKCNKNISNFLQMKQNTLFQDLGRKTEKKTEKGDVLEIGNSFI